MGFFDNVGAGLPQGVSAAQFAGLDTGLVQVGQVRHLVPFPGQTNSGAVTTWQLRDHTGAVAASGGAIASNGNWTVPALPYGWYRLYLYNGTLLVGGISLIVLRTITGMPPIVYADEYSVGVWALMGANRMPINDASNPSADYAHLDPQVTNVTTNWQGYDTARPKHQYVAFPNGTAGNAAGVTAAVNHFTAVEYWEGMNEPGGVPADWFVPTQQEFYNAVKAARSSAKVLGPCPVTINGSATTNLGAFFAAGGGAYIDVISFHTYNIHLGDLTLGRRCWDDFVTLLTTYGQQAKPRAITEAGSFFAAEYGAGAYLRQAVQGMLDLLLADQYGVTKENYWWFYFVSHGFDSYPSWLGGSGAFFPAYAMFLTHSQELLGTTFEARHDFGTIDNNSIIGNSYRKADTTGVVAVMASGRRSAQVTYQIAGGSPSSFVGVDCWGNAVTLTPTGGLLTLSATVLPTYIRLPAGVTLTPVDGNTRYGANRTTGATATASGGTLGSTLIGTVLSGQFKNSLYNNVANGSGTTAEPWQSNIPMSTTSPQTFEVDLSGSTTVDTVLIHCPPPWQYALNVIKDADVQTWDGTNWVTQATISETPTVVLATSTKVDTAANAWYDSYWDDAHIFEVHFPVVTTTKVRLNVREVSYGGIPSKAALAASGNPSDLAGMGTASPRLVLQRITVLDSTNGAAGGGGSTGGTGAFVVKHNAFA